MNALKPISSCSSKTLLFLSPSSSSSSSSSPFPLFSIIVSHFCNSSSSLSLHSQNFHTSRRHHLEEESRNVKVSVWWDFENCNLPTGVNVFKVSHAITAAIRANGIKGPVQITAFGDVVQLSRAKQEALSSTGINLTHVPRGGKNSADRSLLVDLMYWVSQNPPPAHLFLISGDKDFASVLHRLRMNNYNILLATRDNACSVLCCAASIMWRWDILVKGESLIGKVFNQPPDGPYGSWYGHYEVPLEDPFLNEQLASIQGEEPAETASQMKLRPIPKAVMNQVRGILSLYPKGIEVSRLRLQLLKKIVGIDKDFYGHKKLTPFLFSMPNIVKLRNTSDGFIIAHGVNSKPEPFASNPCSSMGLIMGDGGQIGTKSIESSDEELPISASVDQNPSIPSYTEPSTEDARKLQQSPPSVQKAVKMDIERPAQEIREPHSVGEKDTEVLKAHVTGESLIPVEGNDTELKVGFLKKVWRKWFSGIDDSSRIKGCEIAQESQTSHCNSQKKGANTLESDSIVKKEAEKFSRPPQPENSPTLTTSYNVSNNSVTSEKETSVSSELFTEKSEKRPGFIYRIKKLFWGSGVTSNSLVDQPSGNDMRVNDYSELHGMISDDSFWRDMESFLNSEGGSLVSQSRTRQQLARNLQKDGPAALRSLSESDTLRLVDMLISEKKWVQEYPSDVSPFKLARSFAKDTSVGVSRSSNGLRSIFLSTKLPSCSKRQAECDGDDRTGRISNISHAGVPQPVSCEKPSKKSRNQILVDCQKLVKEILKEFPDGYNISSFKKLFFERYGYHIDCQKLGYRTLASLLQIIPGVKIESTYILPASKAVKCSIQESDVPNVRESKISCTSTALGGEVSDVSKDDKADLTWEELGPVEKSVSKRKEQEEKCRPPHPEPFLSDDESESDSEGEPSAVFQPEGRAKSRVNTEKSSLLEILDDWYSSKDGVNKKEESEKPQEMVNGSENPLQRSDPSGLGSELGSFCGNYGTKQRAQKSYSFVAVPGADDPGKLVHDILVGSMKKSGGTKMQS